MTARYFKATRPNGTDFCTGTIKYEVGATVTHPAKKKVRDDPSTYLSVATVPTDCTGMRWPCRLFTVEGVGRPLMGASGLSNKRCFSAVRVIEELPAHEALGSQGEQVVALIERASRLTADEASRLRAAWDAARDAAWDAARDATGDAARDAAWVAAGDAAWDAAWDAAGDAAWVAAWDAAWVAARDAAWVAATALVVRDLISSEQFDALYGPWREVIGEERSEQ